MGQARDIVSMLARMPDSLHEDEKRGTTTDRHQQSDGSQSAWVPLRNDGRLIVNLAPGQRPRSVVPASA